MTTFFDRRIGDSIARLVCASARRHRMLLFVVAIATALAGLYSARNLGVNAELASLFSDDLPYRMLDRDFAQAFPALYENLVVVIDAPTPERSVAAARYLAGSMARDERRFRHVLHAGSEFFERHAFLYAELDDLDDLADRLARFQPYLAGLAADPSLAGFSRMLARGATTARDGEFDGAELAVMFGRVSDAIAAYERGQPYEISWSDIIAPAGLPIDTDRQIIIAQPVLDLSAMLAAAEPIEFVREIARDVTTAMPGVRVRISGDMALAYEEMAILERQMAWASIASFCIVAATMVFAFRSVRLVFLASINMLVGLVWTMFFATVAIGHLNVISVAFAVLFIGLSDDYGIHFCMRYHELRRRQVSHLDALRDTSRDVGVSICICAVTTAIGFYAFIPTDFRGVAELGLISGTGMFINVLLCFTFLPALVTLAMGRQTVVSPARVRAASRVRPPLPLRRPALVATAAGICAVAAALALPHARFDADPLDVRDPSAESVQTFRELVRDGEGSPWNVSVVAEAGEDVARLAARLRALPEVASAVSIEDFLPGDQSAKRAVLDDVALFLAPSGMRSESSHALLVDKIDALRALGSALAALARRSADDDLSVRARQLALDIERVLALADGPGRGEEIVAALEASLLSTLPTQLERLDAALRARAVTLDSLPRALVERMVAVDGRHRIEVAPRADLADDDALARFVAAVRSETPYVTGGAVSVYESERAVVDAFRKAFALAAVAIALLLALIWRSVADTALVMTPLALAALLTTAIAVATATPFNYANVIVLPLLFGLGVNSGIHLVERWRLGDAAPDRLLETSTAKAVVYSSLNTVGSFGTLAFATHYGMASMGRLLALGVALTVVCNLVVLPALIALRSRRRSRL